MTIERQRHMLKQKISRATENKDVRVVIPILVEELYIAIDALPEKGKDLALNELITMIKCMRTYNDNGVINKALVKIGDWFT